MKILLRPFKKALICTSLILAFFTGYLYPSPPHMIDVYENEDLSGQAYIEPLDSVIVHRSAGWVCYANDSAGLDERQLYVSCEAFRRAGGKIAQ